MVKYICMQKYRRRRISIGGVSVKKLIVLLITVSLILSLVSCGDSNEYDCTLKISQKNILFSESGATSSLSVRTFEDGREITGNKIEWSTSDPSVATCDENGNVTSVGYGICVVRASYKSASASCTVKFANPNPPLSLSESELKLDNIGAQNYITAVAADGSDLSSIVTWTLSTENVISCDDGLITAIGYGSCTLTAKYNGKTAICTVTVTNPTAEAVILSNDSLSIEVGEIYTLTADSNDGTEIYVKWLSSNAAVASCENGDVIGKSTGVCVIIAMTDSGKTDACIVTVGSPKTDTPPAELLTFDFKDIHERLDTVDSRTGTVLSSAIVTSYSMYTKLLDDGRLVVEITLRCVKTYDYLGPTANTPFALTASLYRESDAFLDKKVYKTAQISVGDSFTVQCSGFTVQTNKDGTPRELYMTFSSVTEIDR